MIKNEWMNSPYRELATLEKEQPVDNVYRYILRKLDLCPVCSRKIPISICRSGYYEPNPDYKLCHPLKRISVKGIWWWKKYCPVDGIHQHITCNKCYVDWIVMTDDQETFETKEAYL